MSDTFNSFNRKRAGEAQRMKVSNYLDAKQQGSPAGTIVKSLTKFEMQICNTHTRVEIQGKKDRKVAVPYTLPTLYMPASSYNVCICQTEESPVILSWLESKIHYSGEHVYFHFTLVLV